MRILVVSPSYPPRTGGGEKYAHRTNTEFVRQGMSVHVVTNVSGSHGAQTMDGVTVEYAKAMRFVGFPWFNPALIASRIRSIDPGAVVVYGPSPHDPITAVVARLMGRPFVPIYHADFNDREIPTRIVTWLHNQVALRLANAIICTNETMRQRLAKRGFGKKVVVSIPGVDDRFFSEALREPDRDLLFVAALDRDHAYKRLDLLLNAVAAMARSEQSVHLTVVGDGDTRADFERMANELGISDRVEFLGRIDDATLTGLYRRARAFVLPSPTTQEGFGLVCLEAMASGLPVVCSKNAGASVVVRQAPACAVWDGEDPQSLIDSIQRARTATMDEREHLRQFTENFSWGASVDRLTAQLRTIGAFHKRAA